MASKRGDPNGSVDQDTTYEATRPTVSRLLRDRSRLGLAAAVVFLGVVAALLVFTPRSPTSPTPGGSAGSGQVSIPAPVQNSN
jgi:hypothetical protein